MSKTLTDTQLAIWQFPSPPNRRERNRKLGTDPREGRTALMEADKALENLNGQLLAYDRTVERALAHVGALQGSWAEWGGKQMAMHVEKRNSNIIRFLKSMSLEDRMTLLQLSLAESLGKEEP
jgi:hypothetical protein